MAAWAISAAVVGTFAVAGGAARLGVAVGANTVGAGAVIVAAGEAALSAGTWLAWTLVARMGVSSAALLADADSPAEQTYANEFAFDTGTRFVETLAGTVAGKLFGKGLGGAIDTLGHAETLGMITIVKDAEAPPAAPSYTVGGGRHTDPGDDLARIRKLSQLAHQIPGAADAARDLKHSVTDEAWDPAGYARAYATDVGGLFEGVLYFWNRLSSAKLRAEYKPLVDQARSDIVGDLRDEATGLLRYAAQLRDRIAELERRQAELGESERAELQRIKEDVGRIIPWPDAFDNIADQFERMK